MNDVFDRYYQKYDLWYDTHRYAFLSEVAALQKVLPQDAKGVEIGVGTGRFAGALGIPVGIDPSAGMLESAQHRGVTVVRAAGEALPFLSGVFDYATLVITLCFVRDPAEVLAEASRVLTAQGRMIIGIVDKESFLGKHYQSKESVFYPQARFFSVPEVTNLLRAAGFGSCVYYQTVSVLPEEMSEVEQPKEGYGNGGFVVIAADKGA